MIVEGLNNLEAELIKLDEFCEPSPAKSMRLATVMKSMYSIYQQLVLFDNDHDLIVNELDFESVWEQLRLNLTPHVRKIDSQVSKKLNLNEVKEPEEKISNIKKNILHASPSKDTLGAKSLLIETEKKNLLPLKDKNVSSNSIIQPSFGVQSLEDDKLSDLEDEMEPWLDVMDNMYENSFDNIQSNDNPNEEEENLRLVQKAFYESEGNESDQDEGNDETEGNQIYFSDFFGKVDSVRTKNRKDEEDEKDIEDDNEYEEDEEEEIDEDDEDDEDDEGEMEREEELDEYDENQFSNDQGSFEDGQFRKQNASTKLQRRSAAMSNQIEQLEKDLMSDKPWEMKGEVKASQRPENSLLELDADLERVSKPAPVVTQEYTSSIEEMIKRRIRDENFDDVKVKHKDELVQDVLKSNTDQDLSQEKSKVGLGEIYVREFMANSVQSNSTLNGIPDHVKENRKRALALFESLSRELDALSHFHYTPRSLVKEDSDITTLDVVNGKNQRPIKAVSALSLEDVVPTTFSHETSHSAPEEVLKKKNKINLIADVELTSLDRKRIRSAKKKNQPIKKHLNQKVNTSTDKKNEKENNSAKESAVSNYSKSSQFFNQMQQEVTNSHKLSRKSDNLPSQIAKV